MRSKQITFLALMVFFLSQFGRVINYAYCKVVAYEKTQSFVCDCEKLLYSIHQSVNAEKQAPAESVGLSPAAPDTLYFLQSSLPIEHAAPPCNWPPAMASALYFSFRPSVFHPPLTVA